MLRKSFRPLRLRAWIIASVFTTACFAQSRNAPEQSGRDLYDKNCSVCHGENGAGRYAPAIAGKRTDDQQLRELIQLGRVRRGMPAFPGLTLDNLNDLIKFLNTLTAPQKKAPTTSGVVLEGTALYEAPGIMALQTPDQLIHLLRHEGSGKYREATSQADWTSYDGNLAGNRYSTLDQIAKSNVALLTLQWTFTIPDASFLEVTPLVVAGVMYVTSANQCYALDAGNGRELWHFRRDRTRGVGGYGGAGVNRGAASSGSHIFMVTDNAHLLSINRFTGKLEWESVLADWHQNYETSSAPLVVGDLVISGTAGGERGGRGFLAAFDVNTGKEAWRFWTVPEPGEPGSETWKGAPLTHGGAVTWFTGSYDPGSDTVFWQTGNPAPDFYGQQREGDNLYSDSVLALDRKSGKLKWYYQFTPHDTHDWDATEPLALIDTDWRGQPRQLLVTGNRNGFLYIFDRTQGRLLMATPFVQKLNWAKEVGSDHRPVLTNPEMAENGTKVCPSIHGGTNWFSAAFSPKTGFFYLQTLESCDIYTAEPPADWQAGKEYLGGSRRSAPGEAPKKILRALDIQTGKIVWEYPQEGRGDTWGGVLATAGGLVFFCDDSGLFIAADAATGKQLWSASGNPNWHASPMTYQFDDKQYVTIASGKTITSFAFPN